MAVFPLDLSPGYYFEIGLFWFLTLLFLVLRFKELSIMYENYKSSNPPPQPVFAKICHVDLTVTQVLYMILCVDLQGFFGIYTNCWIQWAIISFMNVVHSTSVIIMLFFVSRCHYCYINNVSDFSRIISTSYFLFSVFIVLTGVIGYILTAYFDDTFYNQLYYCAYSLAFATYGVFYSYFIFSSRQLLLNSLTEFSSNSRSLTSLSGSLNSNLKKLEEKVDERSRCDASPDDIIALELGLTVPVQNRLSGNLVSSPSSRIIKQFEEHSFPSRNSEVSNKSTRAASFSQLSSPPTPSSSYSNNLKSKSAIISIYERDLGYTRQLLYFGIFTAIFTIVGFIYSVYQFITIPKSVNQYQTLVRNKNDYLFKEKFYIWIPFCLTFILHRASRNSRQPVSSATNTACVKTNNNV